MKTDKRKIVIVGTGMVGMSYAYCLLNQSVCDELVLIDVDKKRAEGEAMDLNHGLAFAGSSMKIYAGEYKDCQDADLVVIAAGVAQKQGETRLDLLKRNTKVFRSVIEPVTASGFNGIFLVATNPVDIMTRITCTLSGFNPRRVLGSGTALDTARLRYLLGEFLQVDPRNIHAYVMGEHGDSEFVPWSQAFLATKSILELDRELESSLTTHLFRIEEEVRTAAYKIIEAKKATYYGIGMALTRITKAILGDEHSVLTVSAVLRGEYDQRDVFTGVPCILNQNGVQRILPLSLTKEEKEKFDFLNDFFKDHCQTYSVTGSGKRPIYWLFDSGKQNGFKALVYLHRYTPDTIGNLRIDYLHKMQRVYESEINRMQDMMDHSGNAREVAAASKRKDKLAKQLKECREYDEKISHLALSRIELDLDDGVKVNYRKLQTAQDGKFYEVLADSKNIMVKEKK